jgi:hypothetical protein
MECRVGGEAQGGGDPPPPKKTISWLPGVEITQGITFTPKGQRSPKGAYFNPGGKS